MTTRYSNIYVAKCFLFFYVDMWKLPLYVFSLLVAKWQPI